MPLRWIVPLGLAGLVLLYEVMEFAAQDRTRRDVLASAGETLIFGALIPAIVGLLLTRMAQQAAEIQQARREALELAYTDPLTGLHNRRYLMERLTEELARTTREDSTLAVIMADVDNLKAINDRFGHQQGDQVLKAVATSLRDNVRLYDTVSRIGGDEFLLVLPRADADAALKVAERIQSRVSAASTDASGESIRTAISMGIATFPASGKTPEDLTKAADDAMYQAKKAGGNTIRVAGRVEPTRRLFGEYLQDLGLCTQAQVEEALRYSVAQASQGRYLPIGQALVELGYASQEDIQRALDTRWKGDPA